MPFLTKLWRNIFQNSYFEVWPWGTPFWRICSGWIPEPLTIWILLQEPRIHSIVRWKPQFVVILNQFVDRRSSRLWQTNRQTDGVPTDRIPLAVTESYDGRQTWKKTSMKCWMINWFIILTYLLTYITSFMLGRIRLFIFVPGVWVGAVCS